MDKTLTVIKKEISPLVKEAEIIVIKNQDDMVIATSILSQMNKVIDKVKEEKEKVTKPLNEALKAERSRWKPIEEMFETGITVIRSKMTEYQTKAVAKQKENEQKIADKIASGKISIDKAIDKLQKVDKPENNIETSDGSAQFMEVKCFEVVDVEKLPKAYILPNEVMIRSAMKNGYELPGVRYYTEMRPRNIR